MGFFSNFRSFLMKGNIIDLATAVIIGGAFGKVISSLVNDILMPLIGLLLGGVDFTDKFLSLDGNKYASLSAAKEAGAAVLTYGNFIQVTLDFVIIGLAIYLILKSYEKIQNKKEVIQEAPKGPTQEELLTEIRDLLKKK